MIDTAEPKPDFSMTEPQFALRNEVHIYFDRAQKHKRNADSKLTAIAKQYALGAGELLTGGALVASSLIDLLEQRADLSTWLRSPMGIGLLVDAIQQTPRRVNREKSGRLLDVGNQKIYISSATKNVARLFASLTAEQKPDEATKKLDKIELTEDFNKVPVRFIIRTNEVLNKAMKKRLSFNPDSENRYDLVDIKADLLASYRVYWAEEMYRQNYFPETQQVLDYLEGSASYFLPPKEAKVDLPIEIKNSESLILAVKLISEEASKLQEGSYAREDRIAFLESALLGQLHASHFLFCHSESKVLTLIQPLLKNSEALLQSLIIANPQGIDNYRGIIMNYIEASRDPRKYCEMFYWGLRNPDLLNQFEQKIKGIFS